MRVGLFSRSIGGLAAGQILAAGLLAVTLGVPGAVAQTYPSKPIKMVVPYTPGSPVFLCSRSWFVTPA